KLDGLSPVEIAERIGCTRDQVNGNWREAKRNLLRTLATPAAEHTSAAATADPWVRLEVLDKLTNRDQAQDHERAQLRADLDQAVAQLPDQQRSIAELRLAGADYDTITARTGYTRNQP